MLEGGGRGGIEAGSVAFFRNLNLGQRRSHSPTRQTLLAAFEQAGATSAASFQVNGTVIFETDRDPQQVADLAVRLLTPLCGYDDAVLVRPVPWVLDLELEDAPGAEVSFFAGPDPFPVPLPWTPPNGGLRVVHADAHHALSLNELDQTSGATRALERLLGVSVTSRAVTTMLRLRARLR